MSGIIFSFVVAAIITAYGFLFRNIYEPPKNNKHDHERTDKSQFR